MHKLVTIAAGGIPRHWRTRTTFALSFVFVVGLSAPTKALDGPFLGLDLGASKPVNNNYKAHVENGMTANPYVGYMFNNYLGLQFQAQLDTQFPDNDHRGFANENTMTTTVGYLLGPRLQVPLIDTPWGQPMEFYMVGQGGGYTGLSGRLNQTSAGLSAGAGIDVYLTDHIALSIFGRYNRAFQAPRPSLVGTNQLPDQASPADAQWASGGLGVKYRFNGPVAAPAPPPPAPVAQAAPPPAEKKKIVLRGVNFDFDKSNIRPDARPILDEAISTLKEYKQITLSVEGHTDNIGTEQYNDKLSMRRAKSVADYLAKGGIDAKRMTEKGLGESQPVASNDTAEGRAQNRRVELKILQGP